MDEFCIDSGLASALDELDEDEARCFAELHEDDEGDESQTELCIYASCIAFQRGGSVNDLARALQKTEEWISSVSPSQADSERRERILGAIIDLGLQRKLQGLDITNVENRYVNHTVVIAFSIECLPRLPPPTIIRSCFES